MKLVSAAVLSLVLAFSSIGLTFAAWPDDATGDQWVEQCPGPKVENLPAGAWHLGLLVGALEASTITGWGSDLFTQKLRDLKAITQGHCWDVTNYLDQLIQKSTYTPVQQMNGDIVHLRSRILGPRIGDYCKCECSKVSQKRLYSVWKSPYGPGTKCLTKAELQGYIANGHGYKDLGQSCK